MNKTRQTVSESTEEVKKMNEGINNVDTKQQEMEEMLKLITDQFYGFTEDLKIKHK